ncbi:MAG: ECF transporter S component [Candidatus Heimdallarchaeota archaeon]|nr:ECF transporter S component [Candidatus Heimdallarchaeota archaeon]
MEESNFELKNTNSNIKETPNENISIKENCSDVGEKSDLETDLTNLPLTVYTPKNHSLKVAILAIFTALGAALSSLFIYFPNIEFMTFTLFIGGIILGPLYGSFLALLSASLYEIIATAMIGPGVIIFPFKIVAFLLIAITGALIGHKIPTRKSSFWRFFLAIIGGLLTIAYDLIVNIGWILISNDFKFIGYFTALIIGLPITASKVACNAILFFFITDILNRTLLPIMVMERKVIKKNET